MGNAATVGRGASRGWCRCGSSAARPDRTLANAHNWSVKYATDTPVLYTSGDITMVAAQQAGTYSFFGGGLPAFPTSVWIKPDGTIASIRLGYGTPGDTTQRFIDALP